MNSSNYHQKNSTPRTRQSSSNSRTSTVKSKSRKIRKIRTNDKRNIANKHNIKVLYLNKYEGENLELRPNLPKELETSNHNNNENSNQNRNQNRIHPDKEFLVKWSFKPNYQQSINGTRFDCTLFQNGKIDYGHQACSRPTGKSASIRKNNAELVIQNLNFNEDSGK